jgi:hypothetical protein
MCYIHPHSMYEPHGQDCMETEDLDERRTDGGTGPFNPVAAFYSRLECFCEELQSRVSPISILGPISSKFEN